MPEMTISDLPCDETSKRALRSVAADGIRGHLIIVEGAGDLAGLAAGALARAVVRPDAVPFDVRIAEPEADKWAVADVTDRIARPAALTPIDRTVIVVEAADQMDVAAAEHLLRTVEEPPARALFIFAVRDVTRLLATLRGRSSLTLTVTAPPVRERVATLVAAGVDQPLAANLVAVCGDLVALCAAVADNANLAAPILAGLGAPFRPDTPTADAVTIVAALETVAKSVEPERAQITHDDDDGEPAPSAKKVADAAIKARVRTLSRALITRWRAGLSAELTGALDAARMSQVTAAAEALDDAEAAVGVYVPVVQVLAALLTWAPPVLVGATAR